MVSLIDLTKTDDITDFMDGLYDGLLAHKTTVAKPFGLGDRVQKTRSYFNKVIRRVRAIFAVLRR